MKLQLIERLRRAKASIDDPSKWGKGDDRECLCALDALRVLEDETDADVEVVIGIARLAKALPEDFLPDDSDWNHPVAQFNDAPETTHDDVMAMYDRAIDAAEGRADG